MMEIQTIGTIHTPFQKLEQMPIQPGGAKEVRGQLLIDPQYQEGLSDLQGFSHIYLIYFFHEAKRTELTVTPFMDTSARGVFATRSPLRPSHIGLSLTKVIAVNDNIVTVEGIDILDGTPLIDIKPYIPQFETVDTVETGWMQSKTEAVINTRSDKRFI